MARYADPIVDTFADVLAKSSAILFGPESEKEKNTQAFIAIAKLYHKMMETNLTHHGKKWAAGESISIADFVMASWIGNFVMNVENPFSPTLKSCLEETPKFKAYCANVMNEFTHLKTRGKVGAF